MFGHHEKPIVPRNGHTLIVGIVARISGCQNQKELSLQDQIDHAKADIAEMYDGPVEFRIISTKAKGKRIDRPELEQIEVALRSGELDFLWFEDLARLVRGEEAVRLMGIGVDHGTHSLCPHDGLDTREGTWHQDALNACAEHVAHQEHTSRRLKIKLMNRFKKLGGAPGRPIAGYIVPEGAKTYSEWQKDSAFTAWIEQGLRILAETKSGEAVAEYFNQVGMPTGPYCRKDRWDGRMALRYYRNRLLGGAPSLGAKHSVKHNETGRRVSVKNPNGPCFIEVPQLAHVDLAALDEVIALVAEANKDLGSPGTRQHGLGARRRSLYPGGGGATCWYCGRDYVWGGNGVSEHLMCSGARVRACWNTFGFDGVLAGQRVLQVLTQELYNLEGFDAQYRRYVQEARQDAGGNPVQQQAKLAQDLEKLVQQELNVANAIAQIGLNDALQQKLAEIKGVKTHVAAEQRELKRRVEHKLEIPETVADLRRQFEMSFHELAATSPAFADLLKKLVTSFHVYLVRLADGGHPLPRAKLTLQLDGLMPDAHHVPGLTEFLHREVTIDLFEAPPQREAIRTEAVLLAAQGLDQRAIAPRLKVTQPAVTNALALDRLLKERGLTSPYVVLAEPPEDYSKLRRHHHPHYAFAPRAGYQRPAL